MTWFKSPFSLQNVLRQQRLNLAKRPTTKTSQEILQISLESSMERKKKYKVLLCTTARQDLYVESSEVHNFDINRCDEEKQKKHIAANWVATPVTLTGHIGSLREHIYAALVGTEKWPTFVLVDMSLSLRCDLCNVCPCAMYFRLLFFNGSENAVITLA